MKNEPPGGTWLGSPLLAAREKAALLRASLQTPEAVGTACNDRLGVELEVLLSAEAAVAQGRPEVRTAARALLGL